jgi:hypothetical protein
MEDLSRRNVIRSVGLALAAPLAGPLQSVPGLSKLTLLQNAEVEASKHPKLVPLQPHFIRFVHDQSLSTFAKLRKRTAEGNDLLLLSTSIHTLAQHYRDTGIDSAVQASAPSVNIAEVGQIPPPDFAKFVAYAKTFDQSITASTFWAPHQWPTQNVSSALTAVATDGLSKMLDDAADRIHAYALAVRTTPASSEVVAPGNLEIAVYESNNPTKAHMVRTAAQSCGCNPWIEACPKPEWCDSLGVAWTFLSSAVAAIIQVCTDHPETWVFCAALTDAIAGLGVGVATIQAWSILVIGAILLIICT